VGVLGTTGIGSATYALGGAPSLANLVGMEQDLVSANADTGSLAYAIAPDLLTGLKTTETITGSGSFLWENGQKRGDGRANGLPSHVSGNVPAGYVLLGNWSDLLIGMWSTLEILVDPYTDLATGKVRIRALLDVDFGVRHAASFSELHESAV